MLFMNDEFWKTYRCGQEHFKADYEKGSRDKDRQAEVRKTFGEVGDLNEHRKVEGEACRPLQGGTQTPDSFKAFLDQESKIPPNQSWFG
jgi:hypothetical protein